MTAEQTPDRLAECPADRIPQCNVDPGNAKERQA
jgi:hypothetical protein